MKKITRILMLAIAFALALSVSAPVFAYAYTENEEYNVSEDNAEEAESSTDSESTDESFFASLYTAFEKHLSEILSALAFVGSVIIMLCYKRGFLPIVNDGLKALAGGVKNINEKTESFNSHAINLCESIENRLAKSEEIICGIQSYVESLDEKLENYNKSEDERAKTKIILASQIDMLYEIFMSASLPQYLKDNVGEKIAEMKATLGKEADNGLEI